MGLIAKLKKVKDVVAGHAKNDPTLLSKVAVKLGEVVTDKGDTIVFEGDTLTENMPVFTIDPNTGEEVPVVTGDYVLQTGETITITDGVCTKITPAASGEEKPATPAPPPATTPASTDQSKTATKTIERHEIESYFKEAFQPEVDKLKTEIETLKADNAKLKTENETLTADKTKLSAEVTKLGKQESGSPAVKTVTLGSEKSTPKTKAEIQLANMNKLKEAYK